MKKLNKIEKTTKKISSLFDRYNFHYLDKVFVSCARAMKRFVEKILAFLLFFAGFLPILYNEKRQGLHDKVTKTLVMIRDD